MRYVVITEEVTATLLAQSKHGKCGGKRDNRNALLGKIDKLEKINAETKNKLTQSNMKKGNGESDFEAELKVSRQKVHDAQSKTLNH